MANTFENAPLVELIAELRWNGPSTDAVQLAGDLQVLGLVRPGTVKAEEFYSRFASLAAKYGKTRSERLIPPNFPVPLGQVVYRFRHEEIADDPVSTATMWQVGPSVFAANGLPPYKSWKEFRPIVKDGVESLLASRDESETDKPFTGVSLRYIDAFKGDLLQGLSHQDFISESLGLQLHLPSALTEHLREGTQPEKSIAVQIPLNGGMNFSLKVASGTANGESAVMMEMLVVHEEPVPPDLEKIMDAFDRARLVSHSAFEGMASKFWQLLKPVKGE